MGVWALAGGAERGSRQQDQPYDVNSAQLASYVDAGLRYARRKSFATSSRGIWSLLLAFDVPPQRVTMVHEDMSPVFRSVSRQSSVSLACAGLGCWQRLAMMRGAGRLCWWAWWRECPDDRGPWVMDS